MARLAVLGLAFWSIGFSTFAQVTVAGRKVSATIVNPEDLSPVAWQGASPSISSAGTEIKSDDTIYSLMQANGIYPDSEAFTLVYDLNPSLRDLNKLNEGTNLELPRIAAEDDLAKLRASGKLARISVDPDLRMTLGQSAKKLEELTGASAGVTSPKVQDQLKSLVGWYLQIDRNYQRHTGPPLRRETLQQLSDEATALNTILQSSARKKQPLSADDVDQIGAIYDDLAKIMVAYRQSLGNSSPKSEDACDVVVHIKGGNPNESAALRVYYTFNGIYRDPPSDPPVRSSGWMQLGSDHSEQLLNNKSYKLWAAPDGNPGHPLTTPYRLETACGAAQIAVDLSVVTKGK